MALASVSRVDIDFFLVAPAYTLSDTDVLDNGSARCVAPDVGFVIGAPFASGILATGAVPAAYYRCGVATTEVPARFDFRIFWSHTGHTMAQKISSASMYCSGSRGTTPYVRTGRQPSAINRTWSLS